MEEKFNKKGANIKEIFLKLGHRYIIRTKLIINLENIAEGIDINGIHHKPNNKRSIKYIK